MTKRLIAAAVVAVAIFGVLVNGRRTGMGVLRPGAWLLFRALWRDHPLRPQRRIRPPPQPARRTALRQRYAAPTSAASIPIERRRETTRSLALAGGLKRPPARRSFASRVAP